MDILELDLEQKNLLPPRRHFAAPCSIWTLNMILERNALLAELKVHIREVENSGPLFSPNVENPWLQERWRALIR